MHKRLIIISVFCTIGVFCCKAQSATSAEDRFFDEACTTSPVVCINPADNNNTIICYNDSVSATPCFVYHTHSGTADEKKFQWQPTSNLYGSIYYRVYDMVIIGGLCYFCGGKSYISGYEYTMSGLLEPISVTMGFFGWFNVAQLSSPSSTTLDLYLFFLSAGELKRMDGILESGTVKLGLISDQTLALVTGSYFTWSWHVQDVVSSERLEDIAITANHLVTLSRFTNSPYAFGMRCETIVDAFASTSNYTLFNYYNGIKFNTLSMTTSSLPGEAPTRHAEEAVMRMVKHPASDLVTVAYDGLGFTSEDCLQSGFYTAMYLMDFSNCAHEYVNISMVDAQLVTTSLLKSAPYSLRELCHVTTDNTIALLHDMDTEHYGMWSILQDVSWSTPWQPKSLQADYRAYRSMDAGSNGWLYMAGLKKEGKSLLHFRQDESRMERSCLSTRPPAVVEKLSLPADEEAVPIVETGHPYYTITQTHFLIDSVQPAFHTGCQTSY